MRHPFIRSPSVDDLAALPKAEVHVHLEGAVRPATLEELCARKGISVSKLYGSLDRFIDAFSNVFWTMTSPGDYRRLVREYCEDAGRCGIRYAELELGTIGRPYDCLAEAVEEAEKQRDLVIRFVATIPRNFPVEVGWAILDSVKGFPLVLGLGLSGGERDYRPEIFAEVFTEARRRGLRSVPHAGEDAGPESVLGALNALGAERIQHGIRAVDDPALLAQLAERRVPLATCPTSNLRLGVVPSLDEHPLRELWDAGVLVSVNTDDPGFFDCDLMGEYAIAGHLLGLDRAGYARLALNSVESSFAPEALKADLRREINDWAKKD